MSAAASSPVEVAATYSYKPASGLEGASTVVPLKSGGFLEVRRGEKTRWASGEVRQIWTTLDDWKETLPVDAIVTKKTRSTPTIPKADCRSADFQTAVEVMTSVIGKPLFAPVRLSTNAQRAARFERKAEAAERYRQECNSGSAWLDHVIRERRRIAAIERAKPNMNIQLSSGYKKSGIASTLHAQRISDGEFIPLFFDRRRGIIHTPTDIPQNQGLWGTTFAELGVRPVFIMRNNSGRFRFISLEKTAGAE